MKRIIKLTENDLTRIVRRVIREQNEKPPQPPVNSTNPTGNLNQELVGESANFYLENEYNVPILSQVEIENVKSNREELIIEGTSPNVGKVTLKYRCGNTKDFFKLDKVRFSGNFLNDVNDFLAKLRDTLFQSRDWWRNLLIGHVKNYVRQETPKEINEKIKRLINTNKNPIVYPPVESDTNNRYFMEIIKSNFCSRGGRDKATFANTGGKQGSNMA